MKKITLILCILLAGTIAFGQAKKKTDPKKKATPAATYKKQTPQELKKKQADAMAKYKADYKKKQDLMKKKGVAQPTKPSWYKAPSKEQQAARDKKIKEMQAQMKKQQPKQPVKKTTPKKK